jgi:hypothetical protein
MNIIKALNDAILSNTITADQINFLVKYAKEADALGLTINIATSKLPAVKPGKAVANAVGFINGETLTIHSENVKQVCAYQKINDSRLLHFISSQFNLLKDDYYANKIKIIKAYREEFHTGLAETKWAIEILIEGRSTLNPNSLSAYPK